MDATIRKTKKWLVHYKWQTAYMAVIAILSIGTTILLIAFTNQLQANKQQAMQNAATLTHLCHLATVTDQVWHEALVIDELVSPANRTVVDNARIRNLMKGIASIATDTTCPAQTAK